MRTLESKVKSLTDRMEKAAANHELNIEKVNKKTEKEKESNAKLKERIAKLEQAKDENSSLQS